MKTIYKSILSLAVLMTGMMPAWGKQYETLTKFSIDAGSSCNNPAEDYNKLVDGDFKSKWCVTFTYANPHFVEFHHTNGIYVSGYKLTTGNDNSLYHGRNPKDWVLYGKETESDDWTVIDAVNNDNILEDKDFITYEYSVATLPIKFQYFRFEVSAIRNIKWNVLQLTEFQLVTVDEVEACQHAKLVHYDPTPGDCAVAPTIEYWYCSDCKKLFSDAAATQEITSINPSDVLGTHVLAYHDSVAATCTTKGCKEYWSCKVCGKNFSDSQGIEEVSDLQDLKTAALRVFTHQIGEGTSSWNNSYSPFGAWCDTGGSQSLYKASEIGAGGTITSIAYYCITSGKSRDRETKVYLGMTSGSSMSKDAPIAESDMTLVYDGTVCIGDNAEWDVLALDTPFEYDGKSNLVVGVYSSSSWEDISFAQQSTDYVSSIYRQSDDYDDKYNLISETYYSNEYTYHPVIKFGIGDHPEGQTEIVNGILSCQYCHAEDEISNMADLVLDDTHPYLRTKGATVGNLTYSRYFADADQWEAICLPFAWQYTAENAANYDLAEINTYGVVGDTNEDGVVDAKDQKTLLAVQLSVGDKTKANVPYLIRPKQAESITFTCIDGKLKPAKSEEITCGTLKEKLTFLGVNQAKDSLYNDGCYIMKGGQLVKATAEDAALPPFRWYMKSSSSRTPETISIFVRGEHKHLDKNNDGQCDFCSYSYPLPLVSEENRKSLGLGAQYIGYYYIDLPWHLTNAKKMMNNHVSSDAALKFVLAKDMKINDRIYDESGKLLSGLQDWKAVDLPEGCVFDGNNHVLSGIVSAATLENALFKVIESSAVLCNLGICDSYIGYTKVGSPKLASFAVENNGKIENCWSSADIATSGGKTGGIVSENNDGFINYCTFSGSIYMDAKGASGKSETDPENHIIGGITAFTSQSSIDSGNTPPAIDHCHYAGTFECVDGSYTVFGGIYGTTDGYLKTNACWADGKASFDKSIAGARLGGLVGDIPEGLGCGGYPTLYNSYNAMDLSGTSNQRTGGLFGSVKSNFSVEACFNIGKIDNGGSSTEADQVYGYKGDNYSICSYYCYLSETSSEPWYESTSNGVWGCTKEDFASGKVTAILNKWTGSGTSDQPKNLTSQVKVNSTRDVTTLADGKYDWLEVGYDTIRTVKLILEDGSLDKLDSLWNDPIDSVLVNDTYIQIADQWKTVSEETPTWTKVYTIGESGNQITVTLLGSLESLYDTIYYKMEEKNNWYQGKKDAHPVLESTHGRAVKVNHVTEYYAYEGDTLNVVDGYNYESSGRYYVGLATYSRKMSNKWGTLSLPFDIHYQVGKEESPYTLFHLHQVNSKESDGVFNVSVKLEEFRSGTILAGTPMLVRLNTEYLTKGADSLYTLQIEQPKTTAGVAFSPARSLGAYSWRLNGTVVDLNDEFFYQYYQYKVFYIARNQFWYVDADPFTFSISAFRAWMEYNPESYENAMQFRFVMDILDEEQGEETGVKVIENLEAGKVDFVFDLSGRRHSVPQPGINLTRDRKFIVK